MALICKKIYILLNRFKWINHIFNNLYLTLITANKAFLFGFNSILMCFSRCNTTSRQVQLNDSTQHEAAILYIIKSEYWIWLYYVEYGCLALSRGIQLYLSARCGRSITRYILNSIGNVRYNLYSCHVANISLSPFSINKISPSDFEILEKLS